MTKEEHLSEAAKDFAKALEAVQDTKSTPELSTSLHEAAQATMKILTNQEVAESLLQGDVAYHLTTNMNRNSIVLVDLDRAGEKSVFAKPFADRERSTGKGRYVLYTYHYSNPNEGRRSNYQYTSALVPWEVFRGRRDSTKDVAYRDTKPNDLTSYGVFSDEPESNLANLLRGLSGRMLTHATRSHAVTTFAEQIKEASGKVLQQ